MKKELPVVKFYPDCGTYFWSSNDAAKERFKDYGIEVSDLPISTNLKQWIRELTDWWDLIDHDRNYQPSESELRNWQRRANELIDELNEELEGDVHFIFDFKINIENYLSDAVEK